MKQLINKHILLGVTGGIAAYKSADIVRRLREAGASVRVVMTEHAKAFITPLTMQALSGYPVHDDLFDLEAEAAMGHIELARWADAVLIAPATADFVARMSHGEAGDLLTTLCLATKAPIAIAPAMNHEMWKNTLTQQNLQAITNKGLHIFGPAEGSQACGEFGPGRMLESAELVERLAALFATGSLSGKHVLLTAGPTREPIDPVRYMTNASSGKMGYALAEAAYEAGAQVTLISGPVDREIPHGVTGIRVVTASQMWDAVLAHAPHCDIFMGVAAVADYRLNTPAVSHKIAKTESTLTLTLARNPDIIANVAALMPRPYVVGFAAETENMLANAQAKLIQKKLDMVIANLVGPGIGMEQDDNTVVVLTHTVQQEFPLLPKNKLARELIALIAAQQERGQK